jgi:hypothetical protein
MDGIEALGSSIDIRDAANTDERTVRVRHQSYDGGASWYNGLLENTTDDGPNFANVYGDIWRIMFTPTPHIATSIVHEMDTNHLIPGEYTSAHLRVLYTAKERPRYLIKKWTRNAIDCASTLRPGKPIYLASDSTEVLEYGVHYGRNVQGAIMVLHENYLVPSLHLDRGDDVDGHPNSTGWVPKSDRHPPSDYYDTFIDLYMLTMSGCIVYSKGGFGLWAILISGNTPCRFQQKLRQTNVASCNFTKGSDHEQEGPRRDSVRLGPMFLEPMDRID